MSHPHSPRRLLAAVRVGAFFLLLALSSAEASFRIVPVTLNLGADAPVGAFTVHNTGGARRVIQVNAFSWSQPGGDDHHQSTRKLIATPPIFSIAPGESQVVRVGLRGVEQSQLEQAFRLSFREVPPRDGAGFTGLSMALEIQLPVFVSPAGGGRAELSWHAVLLPDRQLKLTAVNRGRVHARIAGVRLERLPDPPVEVAASNRLTYVLPGEQRAWTLSLEAPLDAGSELQVFVAERRGERHEALVLVGDQ